MLIIKKISSIVLIISACTIILVGCKEKKPEIITSIILSNITNEEYNLISESSKPKGTSINDFKKLYVEVKITNSKKAIKRTITIPDLFIVDRYDRIRSTSGGFTEINNIGSEDTAVGMADIIFDSSGLSEEELRSIYGAAEIYVGYKTKKSNMVESKISIGKELTIKD